MLPPRFLYFFPWLGEHFRQSSLVTTTLQILWITCAASCYSPKKSPCVSVSWKMLSFAVYTVYICHLQNDDSLCGNLEALYVRATSGVSYN
jgi:hypothetical protein